ncbi:hypothetical protein YC2023_043920 [Brassica napus]
MEMRWDFVNTCIPWKTLSNTWRSENQFVALELPMLYSSGIRKAVFDFEHESVVEDQCKYRVALEWILIFSNTPSEATEGLHGRGMYSVLNHGRLSKCLATPA